MKSTDIIIFSLSVGFFIIAVHLTMTLGILHAYWVLMLSASLFLYYQYRKMNRTQKNGSKVTSSSVPKKKRSKKRN